MGHLVNPVSFRVGYFSNWVDLWSVSDSLIYSEMLHNTLNCRRLLAYFFDNAITSRLGLLYSHYTYEKVDGANGLIKLYFYDGVVEQKIMLFLKRFVRFNWRIRKFRGRIFRRFVERSVYFSADRFLGIWGFYDYLLARRVVYFFLRLLAANSSWGFRRFVSRYLKFLFFKTIGYKWYKYVGFRKNFPGKKPISIHDFLSYYLRFLLAYGVRFSNPEIFKKLNFSVKEFDISGFLRIFEKAFVSWRPQIMYFRNLVSSCRLKYNPKFSRYITLIDDMENFGLFFFFLYYRLFLIRFRASKFFLFFNVLVEKYFKQLSLYNVEVDFYGLDNDTITASFLSRYMCRKVEMRFNVLHELFKPIRKELGELIKEGVSLGGYKFQFVGRMTRRGKVKKIVCRGGCMPTSSVAAQIDHSFNIGVLRNGVFCVRVWLFRYKHYGSYNFNAGYKICVFK